MTLLEELQSLLARDERLASEGRLLKNKITELAMKNDETLLSLLWDNERIRSHFFTKVKDIAVFDKDKFIKFVNNKQFLPDLKTMNKEVKIDISEPMELTSEFY